MSEATGNPNDIRKGHGAQSNVHNFFLKYAYHGGDDAVMPWDEVHNDVDGKTDWIDVFPKSILSKNDSPDLGFNYGLNPYNGCEGGIYHCRRSCRTVDEQVWIGSANCWQNSATAHSHRDG
jgi:hypothetical protein